VDWLAMHSGYILNYVLPLLWCLLFVSIVDKTTLLSSWYMPILGAVAAFLANSVPIGGGIVYIPALTLLGAQINLGSSFTIATMPIGNGIFGFLRWLIKDPSVFIWESFPLTVIPSWAGSVIAMTLLPAPNTHNIKLFFGLFSFFIGILVLLSMYRGGLRHVFFNFHQEIPFDGTNDNRFDSEIQLTETGHPVTTPRGDAVISGSHSGQDSLQNHWMVVCMVSFLGGLILVPNIGIGPGLVTYFELVLLGYEEQHAIVTGIVTGGWVCVVPFLVHIYEDDVPYALWVLVLPGVFFGAKYSPHLVEWVGEKTVMSFFSIFLFASALIFWIH
jgi:uncharacterized membrane protein YfcA